MKSYINTIMLLLMLSSSLTFAEKMLIYPNGQAPECIQSYEDASEPKTANNVLSAMTPICLNKGGIHVLHQSITKGNSNEVTGIVLECIGEKPATYVIFNCPYIASQGEL